MSGVQRILAAPLAAVVFAAVATSATLPAAGETVGRVVPNAPQSGGLRTSRPTNWVDERAARRVNAVHDLDPDNEKAALAISKVCGIISDFKRVAAEAKHRKGGDDPEPEPTPELDGDAPVS